MHKAKTLLASRTARWVDLEEVFMAPRVDEGDRFCREKQARAPDNQRTSTVASPRVIDMMAM
jgi:hypothetical protein